ncbi:TetR/AcrR family transcriptional regulator [uncultured Propionibacterium sp.]|uniref:TetR/AcrR family transcriptional regulator n=1 Tax=uncultured Propionibacterium sp. TaxID=218066 RepID=UPI00293059A1|nr:TetR/AcrR family transcriptional regulator [uncultured Propionibacterium sp.]
MTDTGSGAEPPRPTARGTSARAMAARRAWQERKRRTTRDAIRRAGRSLLAECDYDDITVNRIARRAGVSQMTFFRHFPTKEDFVVGMMVDDEMLQTIRGVIAAQTPGAPPLLIGRSIIHGLARLLPPAGLADLARWVRLIASHPPLLAALHGRRSGWIDTIETLLPPDAPDHGAPGGRGGLERRMTALLLLDYLTETLSWWALHTDGGAGPGELVRLADRAAAAITDAVRPAGGRPSA